VRNLFKRQSKGSLAPVSNVLSVSNLNAYSRGLAESLIRLLGLDRNISRFITSIVAICYHTFGNAEEKDLEIGLLKIEKSALTRFC